MISKNWSRLRHLTSAALILPLLAGCGTDRAVRLQEAARSDVASRLVEQAIEAGSGVPDLPPDCRRRERSGVAIGDRLDVALLKTDSALGRANARITRCASWHDEIRKGGRQK